MLRTIEVFKIGICSFCECVLQEQLLGEKDFTKSMNHFFTTEEPLDDYIEWYSNEFIFDDGFAQNACNEYQLKYKKIDKKTAYECIRQAFSDTIKELKTYDIAAYMDTLLKLLINCK